MKATENVETIQKAPRMAYNATKFCYTRKKILRGCANCIYNNEKECPLQLLSKLNLIIKKKQERR